MQALLGAAKQALQQGVRGYAAAASAPTRKVAVLGAAGGIGQPLGLLMKACLHRGMHLFAALNCARAALGWHKLQGVLLFSKYTCDGRRCRRSTLQSQTSHFTISREPLEWLLISATSTPRPGPRYASSTPGAFGPLLAPAAPQLEVWQGYAGPEQLGEALEGCDLVIIPAGVPRKPGMTRDDLFKVRIKLCWRLWACGRRWFAAEHDGAADQCQHCQGPHQGLRPALSKGEPSTASAHAMCPQAH